MSLNPAADHSSVPGAGAKTAAGPHGQQTDAAAIDITPARLIMWTILFQIAWNIKKLPGIIQEGILPDPDDFLRLNQIRSWLGGQGWFDVSVSRMDPQFGGDMHWSRLVDAPMAGLIKFFGLFTGPLLAERLMAIVWPTILLIALVLLMVAICQKVIPHGNKLVTLLFTVMCVPAVVEFSPGRIDHHNVQILLFATALLGLVHRERWWGHYAIGMAVAASIGVGIDTFLLLVVLLGFLGLDWALGRDGGGKGLFKTGIGLAATVLALFFVSVPPDQWLTVRPDAISIFYVAFLLLISAGFSGLFLAGAWLPKADNLPAIVVRTTSGLVAAGAITIMMLLLFPSVFSGGLAGVGPELQARWLTDIIEAKSLAAVLAIKPEHWLSTVAFSLVLIGAGAIVLLHTKDSKEHLITIYGMMVLSIAASLFQFRLLRTGIVASIPVCVVFFHIVQSALRERSLLARPAGIAMLTGAVILTLPLTWVALGLAVPGPQTKAATQVAAKMHPQGNTSTRTEVAKTGWRAEEIYLVCNKGSQYAALDRLPKGLVINDLNSGPPVLVFTKHNILAGNYHRNGRAILQTLDFFETDLTKAHAIAKELRADYVVFCDPGAPVPAGPGHAGKLGVHILNGKLPNWLQRISPASERLIVLKILK